MGNEEKVLGMGMQNGNGNTEHMEWGIGMGNRDGE